MINSGFDKRYIWKVLRPGNGQEVDVGKAGRSRAVADARKGTRPAIVWHWLPGQGLGEGDLLGEREQVGPETFKRT